MKLPLRILSFTAIWGVRSVFVASAVLTFPIWGSIVLVYVFLALLLYVACEWKPR